MRKDSRRGFTVIEVMIALCLASLVMVTMFTAFRSQRESYQAQEDVVDLQQAVRAGLSLLADDLRMAGYDPDGTDKYGFTLATSNQFTVTLVSDWDGMNNDPLADAVTDEDGEENTITYHLAANENDPANFNDLVRVADGSNDQLQLIENIRGNRLQFLYTLADGSGP
ncbi:MAG: prepilin-type N-terminal cleavage/methylation domain-containing protein, partial [Desulfobulbaceae bacterium]|nr:prepilin-type N-terminal cleavage/methylation domain-containing protein [Desulfobulbaceae bacterium]